MKGSGFTFIELMVTVGITILLFAGGIASYNRFTDIAKLRQVAQSFKNDLRLIQSKAISGQKPLGLACDQLVGYKVTFTDSSYTTQVQCMPSQALAATTTIPLSQNVKFSPVPSPITFGVLTQGVDISANTDFTFVSGTKSYVITVTPQGDIIETGLQ